MQRHRAPGFILHRAMTLWEELSGLPLTEVSSTRMHESFWNAQWADMHCFSPCYFLKHGRSAAMYLPQELDDS